MMHEYFAGNSPINIGQKYFAGKSPINIGLIRRKEAYKQETRTAAHSLRAWAYGLCSYRFVAAWRKKHEHKWE